MNGTNTPAISNRPYLSKTNKECCTWSPKNLMCFCWLHNVCYMFGTAGWETNMINLKTPLTFFSFLSEWNLLHSAWGLLLQWLQLLISISRMKIYVHLMVKTEATVTHPLLRFTMNTFFSWIILESLTCHQGSSGAAVYQQHPLTRSCCISAGLKGSALTLSAARHTHRAKKRSVTAICCTVQHVIMTPAANSTVTLQQAGSSWINH